MLKCINVSLKYHVNAYAFPLMKINGGRGRAFFGLLLVTPLEQWGSEKWYIAEVTFAYLNITSANFQPNSCHAHTHI